MDDGSRNSSSDKIKTNFAVQFIDGLKEEWAWLRDYVFTENEDDQQMRDPESRLTLADQAYQEKIQSLSQSDVRNLIKTLSGNKKDLNLQIEQVQKQLEECHELLSNLELVGGRADQTMERMNELADRGSSLHKALQSIDVRLKQARDFLDSSVQEQN